MDFIEAQSFFKDMFPNSTIDFEFDDKCIRYIQCIYTDGKLHDICHVEYQKVKIIIKDQSPIYAPIDPHRVTMESKYLKEKISQSEIYDYKS